MVKEKEGKENRGENKQTKKRMEELSQTTILR